jgi:glycosyltransferase involved in cell wall biosynthesis
MRILLVMDPGISVPPKGYGGIERIVALLAHEYKRQGHKVDILASEESFIEGCGMYFIGPQGFPPAKRVMNRAVWKAWTFLWKNRKRYDLIHNFGRLLYLLPVMPNEVKKIMTYQREITKRNIDIFTRLPNKNVVFTGCSEDLVRRAAAPGRWEAVHNAVAFSQFNLTENLPNDAPLIFLGRIERIKGCHTAIAVAKATDNCLIIAGNISKLPEELDYFEEEIKPLIDGKQIIFVGEVNDLQKNEWLGRSKALLMPIDWEEPFGIVMIEAMACGTPVIGFDKGAVPEVVDNHITGFVVHSKEDMCVAVSKLTDINRSACRVNAAQRFDISIIASRYLNLYQDSKSIEEI